MQQNGFSPLILACLLGYYDFVKTFAEESKVDFNQNDVCKLRSLFILNRMAYLHFMPQFLE